jgi:hypothetical protein
MRFRNVQGIVFICAGMVLCVLGIFLLINKSAYNIGLQQKQAFQRPEKYFPESINGPGTPYMPSMIGSGSARAIQPHRINPSSATVITVGPFPPTTNTIPVATSTVARK